MQLHSKLHNWITQCIKTLSKFKFLVALHEQSPATQVLAQSSVNILAWFITLCPRTLCRTMTLQWLQLHSAISTPTLDPAAAPPHPMAPVATAPHHSPACPTRCILRSRLAAAASAPCSLFQDLRVVWCGCVLWSFCWDWQDVQGQQGQSACKALVGGRLKHWCSLDQGWLQICFPSMMALLWQGDLS